MHHQDFRQQASDAKRLLDQLVLENESLRRQVQTLSEQLRLAQAAGSAFGPDTAKAWAKAFEQADPKAWRELRAGAWTWNDEKGRPTGGGLAGLVLDLTATPGDDSQARLNWDMEENRRERMRNARIAAGDTSQPYQRRPYPPRFRCQLAVCSWLDQQGHPGLGATVRQLKQGLRDGSKASLLVDAAFALWKEEAVAKLSGDPLVALKELREAVTDSALKDFNFGSFADAFLGSIRDGQRKADARRTLGVADEADADAIKAAYRRLARVHHPDAGGDAEQFSKVAAAYSLLTA